VSKKIVRDFILKINKERKVTVILTTHDMMDIDALAKRIILIGKGKILYDGSLKKLKTEYGSYKNITVKTDDTIKDIKLKGIISKKKTDGGYNLIIDSNLVTVSKVVNYLSKYHITDLDIDNEQIDDIILKLYEDYKI
jgi:ABC-2 type transport system ATP-binding protein